MRAVIFTGPSMAHADVHALFPGCEVLPPAAIGDVYRALRLRPRAIGVVDGYFDHSLSIHHKEILWALARGVRVYGSASMGALRAAELSAFGMIGVGRIFGWYNDNVLEDEDEVAVLHEAEASGYRMLSEAMVNVRSTLRSAQQAGVVSSTGASAVIAFLKSMHYTERNYRLLERTAIAGIPADELAALVAWLREPQHRIDQKRLDARALVERMRADQNLPASPPSFAFEYTESWHELRRSLDADLADSDALA